MALLQRATAQEFESKEWMSSGETALLFGISVPVLYRWLAAGDFPIVAVKAGGQWRISRVDYEAKRARIHPTPADTAALMETD